MRKDWSHLEKFRMQIPGFPRTEPGTTWAMFIMQKGRRQIRMMAADGDDTRWEHVSVTIKYKNEKGQIADVMPTWDEMCEVKDLFWDPEECVLQMHPPRSQYVNYHARCLHLWRPLDLTLTPPPNILV